MSHHRGEILKGITTCWCRIGEDDVQSEKLKEVRKSIEKAVQLLTCVVTGSVKVVEEYENLVDSDSRLRDLLVV